MLSPLQVIAGLCHYLESIKSKKHTLVSVAAPGGRGSKAWLPLQIL